MPLISLQEIRKEPKKTVLWFDIVTSTVDVCVTYWPRNVCLLT